MTAFKNGFNAAALLENMSSSAKPEQSVGFSFDRPAGKLADVVWTDQPDLSYMRVEGGAAPDIKLEKLLSPYMLELVEDLAAAAACPIDYTFGLLLSFGAGYAGDNYKIKVRAGWTEPTIIWSMLIGNPSHKKSPAFRQFMLPAMDFNRAAASGKLDGLRIRQGEEGHTPLPITSDTTIEALGDIMSKQSRGILIARDELSGWLEGMARYSKASDRPFWTEVYNGDPTVISRMKRGIITVKRAAASVAGGIQPDTLKETVLGTRNDGLMARFLTFYPDRRKDRVDDDKIKDRYEDVYRILSRLYLNQHEGELILSDEARESHRGFEDYVTEMEDKTANKFLLSFIGKLPGLAVRIAGVLHLIEWTVSDKEVPDTYISAGQFNESAQFLLNYALPMAQRTYGADNEPKEVLKAKALITHLRIKGEASFKTSAIMHDGVASLKTKKLLEPVLQVLLDANLIALVREATGGRPSETYYLHPRLLE